MVQVFDSSIEYNISKVESLVTITPILQKHRGYYSWWKNQKLRWLNANIIL